MIEQAYHFGQTPLKLFTKPHPSKKLVSQKPSIFEEFFGMANKEEHKSENDKEVKCSVKIEEKGRIFALLPTPGHLIAIK